MNTIDVHDLPEQDVRVIKELVVLLRQKTKLTKPKNHTNRKIKKIKFGVWSLGVKGKITREEIYDYL